MVWDGDVGWDGVGFGRGEVLRCVVQWGAVWCGGLPWGAVQFFRCCNVAR